MKKPLAPPSLLGLRIKRARKLTDLTRIQFAKLTGISANTLRSWEDPPKGRYGVSRQSIYILLDGLEQCGVHCTKDWLITGSGNGPTLSKSKNKHLRLNRDASYCGEEDAMLADRDSFLSNHSDAVISSVECNDAEPYYRCGDYIGGYRYKNEAIAHLVGCICFIKLHNGQTLLRRIAKYNHTKLTAVPLNPYCSDKSALIKNDDIGYASEIIWHRRAATVT